jgi:hypothetical protein
VAKKSKKKAKQRARRAEKREQYREENPPSAKELLLKRIERERLERHQRSLFRMERW